MFNLAKEIFYKTVSFPLFGPLYRKIYSANIRKKLDGFRISDLIVTIEPSNFCNSRCFMCPYPAMTRKKETMPMELFKKIVDDCRSCGITKFNLNFYNEPFLDNLIFDRIKYIKSKEGKVQFFSNASVMTEEKIDRILNSGLNNIKFSVDGAKKETYEKIRKGLDFDRTVGNILRLVERKKELGAGPVISVVFTRSKLNEGELEEFKNFWSDRVDKVIISYDDNRNKTSDFFESHSGGPTAYPCRRLWTELVVISSGKVVLCCVDADGSVIFGDFNKQGLMEIWNEKRYEEARNLHLGFMADKIPLCKTCVHPYRLNLRSWWRRQAE